MITDYFFWFAQPSSILNKYDWAAGYFFGALLVVAILIWIVRKLFVKHPVTAKLLNRHATALFWTSVVGLIWFAFRYQAIPILSKRVVGGGIIILGLVWLGMNKWYFVRHFFQEKRDYDADELKNKYIR